MLLHRLPIKKTPWAILMQGPPDAGRSDMARGTSPGNVLWGRAGTRIPVACSLPEASVIPGGHLQLPGFFPPLAKLLLWAIRPHLNERLVGNEMGFVLFRDNIKQGKTEIITCCLIKILFSRAQHGAAGWHFLSSQPTFGSCFITSQKKPVRAQPCSYRAESQTASCGCSAVGLCLLLKPT